MNRNAPFIAILLVATLTVAGLVLTACGGKIATQSGQECSSQLHIANQELEDAKVKGFSGSVQWIKAAGLLAEANTQMQFEHFDSCLNKVQRARAYLREAQK
jgi:hypothetical protein